MLRSVLVSASPRAPLTLALLLLAGCGGAAAGDYQAREPPPHGGESAAASAAPIAIASGEAPSFMRVGDVARATLPVATTAAATATAASSAAPMDVPLLQGGGSGKTTTKNLKGTAARVAATPPTKAPEHKEVPEGGAHPDTDADDEASMPPPPQDPKAVHAAVVDSSANLTEAEVRTTIVQKQASFRECYDLGASSGAGFSGTISLRVAIGPTGTVATVDVLSSTTKLATVDSCVTQAVRRIQFPAKGNGAVVAFPIEFGK